MTPYYARDGITLYCGDNREILPGLDADSIHACVSDPPYGLSFMGKGWDHGVPGVEFWQNVLRVLKPGGHLLAFGGTRTYHRLAVAIEDAGFEVRDCMMWMYGSGFPKSLDVGKAIDKTDATDARRDRQLKFTAWMRGTGLTQARIDELTGTNMGWHYLTAASQPAVATRDLFEELRPHFSCDVPEWVEQMVNERTVESENFKRRDVIGKKTANEFAFSPGVKKDLQRTALDITAPATEAAKQWNGWGTALKPSYEPIIVARKPLQGTVAANVLKWGTGGINVDGCRIGHNEEYKTTQRQFTSGQLNRGTNDGRDMDQWEKSHSGSGKELPASANPAGRWPSNILLSHSPECVCTGVKRVKGSGDRGTSYKSCGGIMNLTPLDRRETEGTGYADADGYETVEAWDCVEGCPVRLLDEQSGESGSGAFKFTGKREDKDYDSNAMNAFNQKQKNAPDNYGDTGGASRFFYTSKADKSERRQSKHPTVKPLDLMRYLVRLVCPAGGIVLDPFMGSGSTIEAARAEHCKAVGMDLSDEYCADAVERLRQRVLNFGEGE